MQYNLFIFLVIENILVLFYHSSHNHQEKINLYNQANFFNIKSMNSIQKYPHLIEWCACILYIFVIIFLFPLSFLVSFGICPTLKLSKYITLLPFTYKSIQWVPIDLNSSECITKTTPFIFHKSFLLDFKIQIKGWDGIKNPGQLQFFLHLL